MDAKITLSFDREVIEKAKKYAESQNISLSRLMEFLLRRITSGSYSSLEDLQISDWVMELSEGSTEYQIRRRTSRDMKNEFLNSRK